MAGIAQDDFQLTKCEVEITEVEALQHLVQRVEVELRRPDGDAAVTLCVVVAYQVGDANDDRHDEERHPRPDQQ